MTHPADVPDGVAPFPDSPEDVHAEWRQRPQWLMFDVSDDSPRRPHWRGDFSVSWTDPDDWHTFEEAYEAAAERPEWGIGYMLARSNENYARGLYGGLDLDGCIVEGDDGRRRPAEWLPSLEPLIDRDASIEVSAGGGGLHIPLVGLERPEWWTDAKFDDREHTGVEALTSKFFAVTGHRIDASGDEIAEYGPWVDEWLWDAYEAVEGEPPVSPDDTGGRDPTKSRDELADVDETTDTDDVLDAVAHLRPADLPLRSSKTDDESAGVESWDPAYRSSKTGRSLKRFTDSGKFVDMANGGDRKNTDTWFGVLDLFAYERGIVSCPERLEDEAFWTAIDAAREAGAPIPEYVGGSIPSNPTPPENVVGDGGTATADAGTAAPDAPSADVTLDPETVAAWAGLGGEQGVDDLTDRQKAATVWEVVKHAPDDEIAVRVRRGDGTLWAYDDGIWTSEGERALRHAARAALGGMNYGPNVFKELKEQVRSDPVAEVEPDTFGVETGALAVENGLLDVGAAADSPRGDDAIRDLRPDDYALTRLPVVYDPDADAGEWEALVEEWAETGRADALQEYVGYCLHVGALPIHRALLLVGSGANGKGTFLHVVRSLLGSENTASTELQTLANEPDAVADFHGALANIDDDLSARKLGQGLGMFKKLVAGDRVRGRNLYEPGFEFDAVGKHLYAANEVPSVDVGDDDDAFWRRWLLVEFPNHYPASERDATLRDRLTEPRALSGVLNWAIEGRARLLKQGYFTNEERHAAGKRERWQSWGESVDKFIAECVEHDPDAERLTTGEAHRRYAAWCRENGEDPAGQRAFTNTLKDEDVGYKQSIRVNGDSPERGYDALGLSDDVPIPGTATDREPDPPTGDDTKQQRFE